MTHRVEFIKVHENAELPTFGSDGAAGMDLSSIEDVLLQPGERALVHTGLKIALEHGFEAQVRPRSGLALKHGVTVLNTPGTIDADYRGEVGVILINHGNEPHEIQQGDRIAQLVVKPVLSQAYVMPKLVSEFSSSATTRGEGGYGSTGR